VFLIAGPETILFANGVTFAISAIALLCMRFGVAPQPEPDEEPLGLLQEAREGLSAVFGMVGIRAVVAGSGAMLLFAGLFNVAEVPFVTVDLDGGDAGYALVNALYGLGFVGGSLSGSKGGDLGHLKRWWLIGLAVVSVGFVACGASPGLVVATLAFALAGVGNGLILVYERLLIQQTVPDRLMGRVFGAKDGLTAWAFAAAFLSAGGLVEVLGARALIIAAGVGGLLVWLGSRFVLRRTWSEAEAGAQPLEDELGRRPSAFGRGAVGEDGADAVGGGDGGGTMVDRTH
jgi:MFS family permease